MLRKTQEQYMASQIKGLLFDKDGTLFDFNTTWAAWAEQFFMDIADQNVSKAQELALGLGYDFATRTYDKTSVIIAGTPNEVTSALISAVPSWSFEAMLAHVNKVASEVPQTEPVPLKPLLAGLKEQGLKLGVATNDAEAPARAHLGNAGITHLFDFIAGYDSGFGMKPEPGMQFGFCKAVGLDPTEVLMIGDSTHDLISGRRAGMTTVAVLTGIAEAHELEPFADVILRHIGDLPGYLASQ